MKPGSMKQYIAVLIMITLCSLSLSGPLTADAAEAQSLSASPVEYQLTTSFLAEVKSVVNEKTSEGTRIAAVVRLCSQDSETAVVPEYEVRVETEEGIQYTLRPSSDNAKVIEPKEKVELSYLLEVKRSDDFSLKNLMWVLADEEIYPKKDKIILTIPISAMEWKGDAPVFSDRDTISKWGQPFTIPVLSSSLQFTPVYLLREGTVDKSSNVFILLVENKGETKEFIPDLIINGESDHKVFAGTRVEQGILPLEPGEQRYLYFKIPVQSKTALKSFYVLNSEKFTDENNSQIEYTAGRMHIALSVSPVDARNKRTSYQYDHPIRFDAIHSLVNPDLEISLVELHMDEIEGSGYQTAAAKFKIRNRSNRSVSLPNFGTELMFPKGNRYIGTRQTTMLNMLMPNLSYIINYSFTVPNSEEGERVTVTVLDKQTAGFLTAGFPVASLQTKLQKESESGTTLDIYPFRLTLNDWSLNEYYQYSGGSFRYFYKFMLDLDLERQEDVVIDRNFSALQMELVDANGRILGLESLPFTGVNRLSSGVRTIEFKDVDMDGIKYPVSVHFLETFNTPDGEMKRLVKILQK